MSRKFRDKHIRHEIVEELTDHYETKDVIIDWEEVFTAVKNQDVAQLEWCLYHGYYVNEVNQFEETALHLAAKIEPTEDSLKILQLLIGLGANVNMQDRFGMTPLHIASGNCEQYVEILLDAGSSVNMQDNAGRTALMLSCQKGYRHPVLTMVQYLMDRGANINVRDEDGQNALHYACQFTKPIETSVLNEIIYKLVYAGIDINAEDNDGNSPAYLLMKSINILEDRNVYFMPTGTGRNTDVSSGSEVDIKPLVCAGARLLEDKRIYEKFWNIRLGFFCKKGCVNLLSHLLHSCSDLCRLKYLRNVLTFLNQLPPLISQELLIVTKKVKSDCRNVRTLKTLSRIVIRDSLNGKVLLHSDKLNLPKELVQYVQYTDNKTSCF